MPEKLVVKLAPVSNAPWRANIATLGEVGSAIWTTVQLPPAPKQDGWVTAGMVGVLVTAGMWTLMISVEVTVSSHALPPSVLGHTSTR